MYSIHEARQALASVDLVEGLPLEEVHARLEIGLRLGDTGQGILAFYLAEMADLRRNQANGHRLAVQYAEGRLGMDRRRAGELIAAGRRLRELPLVHGAFCEGTIGWSKVLELIKVAVPEHEEAWLERAKTLNCNELRGQVRLAKAGSKPRAPGDLRGIREPRFPVRATLDKLQYEALRNAKRKLSDERGVPISDAEFLDLAAKLILGSEDDGSVPGRKRVDHSLYQIVLHEERGSGASGGERPMVLDTAELGPVPVDGEGDAASPFGARSAAIRCDAERTSDGDHPHVDQKTPAWLRKRVLHRDGHRCRICGNPRDLEVHHIRFREDGGPTAMPNLITGCNGCHSLVHASLIVIEGTTEGEARFLDAEGKPLARAREYVSPEALFQLSRPQRAPALATVPVSVDAAWYRRHARWLRCCDGSTLDSCESEPPARAPDAPDAPAAPDAAGGAEVEAHPHTLLIGPAGGHRTALARRTAKAAGLRLVSQGDSPVKDVATLMGLLSRLGEGDMLFVEGLDGLPLHVREVLYDAMAYGVTTVTCREGPKERIVWVKLPRCTVLAGVTDTWRLDQGLLSCFPRRIQVDEQGAGYPAELDDYAGYPAQLEDDAGYPAEGCPRWAGAEV